MSQSLLHLSRICAMYRPARSLLGRNTLMPSWKVEPDRVRGVLMLRLDGVVSLEDMQAFVTAHDRAIDGFHGRDYRVFCDIRGLKPLSPQSTELFEKAKRYSAAHKNFKGSAVLADSTLVAMQHQRTSVASGVMSTELISADEKACWDHLEKLPHERSSTRP